MCVSIRRLASFDLYLALISEFYLFPIVRACIDATYTCTFFFTTLKLNFTASNNCKLCINSSLCLI